MATDAYVGLGSNLGDRLANLGAALRLLDGLDGVEVRVVSHVYESEPWGVEDQPPFANAVARLRVRRMPADALLARLKDAEETLGRKPGPRYGPRIIDLDLLLFGDEEWVSSVLTLPHPRMLERDFVVTPLLEIAPDVRLPDGRSVADAARPKAGAVLGVLGMAPGFEHLLPSAVAFGADACEELREAEYAATLDERPFGSDEAWAPGEWVSVGAAWGVGFDLDVKLALLRDAGIPAEPRSRPFTEKVGWYFFGSLRPIDILVPPERAEEAREILRASGADVPPPAPEPEEGTGASAFPEFVLRWGWLILAIIVIAAILLGAAW